MSERNYLIIGFTYREGNVYRRDKVTLNVHHAESAPAAVLGHIRAYAAQGNQVLVFENGFIKSDWCRLHERAYKALMAMKLDNYRRFFNGVDIDLMGLTLDGFAQHVYASFPQFNGQKALAV